MWHHGVVAILLIILQVHGVHHSVVAAHCIVAGVVRVPWATMVVFALLIFLLSFRILRFPFGSCGTGLTSVFLVIALSSLISLVSILFAIVLILIVILSIFGL